MRRRDVEMLRRVASHALDRKRQAVREQTEAVDVLEAAMARIEQESADERGRAEGDPRSMLLLPDYLEEQRSRRHRLAADLAAAREELDRRVRAAHEAWLEVRRLDEMLARIEAAGRAALARREATFLDWLAERQHARVRKD
ncbi:hypothetical protein [Benzoatithermus flavus]|uniref:Flagellar FliJ protein n=1 Tax=Benzoatithermus flavus TaxID=3108223 RepID=A0ABU8XUV5_9PROT